MSRLNYPETLCYIPEELNPQSSD